MTDSNNAAAATETVEIDCRRCGGRGSRDEWRNTGSTCFDCGGFGRETVTRLIAEEIRLSAEQLVLMGLMQLIYSCGDAVADYQLQDMDSSAEVTSYARQIAKELRELRAADKISRESAVKFIRRIQKVNLSGTHGKSLATFGRTMALAIVEAGRQS